MVMKLRAKLLADPSPVYRVEVPDTALVTDLQEALKQHISAFEGATSESLQLSLNKKTCLPTGPEDTVKGVGLCSGDTVWVISPQPLAIGRASDAQAAGVPPRVDTRQPTSTAPSGPSPVEVGTPANIPSSTMKGALLQETQRADQKTPVQKEVVPNYLTCVMQASPALSASAHGLLLLAVHAVMLETGFVSTQASASPYQLSLAATSACTLEYKIASPVHTKSQESVPLPCKLLFTPMGPFLTIHAAVLPPNTSAKRVTSLNLNCQQHICQQHIRQQTTSASAAAAVCSGNTAPSTTTTNATEITSAECNYTSTTSQGNTTASSVHTAGTKMQYLDIPQLWRVLKDGLSLPLLCGCYQAAGCSPPVGLLVLPSELMEAVLKVLTARDLAAITCVCRPLCHLASGDMLWKAVFEHEFPGVQPSSRVLQGKRSWKAEVAEKWRQRKEREEERRRRQAFNSFNPVPFPAPMPGGPPRHPPVFPPNIIGGDYDRLPFMGGFTGIQGGPRPNVFYGPVGNILSPQPRNPFGGVGFH